MSSLLPDRPAEPLQPGEQRWSPRMTWRGRAVAWLLLSLIAVGLLLMIFTAFVGKPG
ncbi:MAG: hypothetical protein AAF916_05460 [Planctomycetota bacterium]